MKRQDIAEQRTEALEKKMNEGGGPAPAATASGTMSQIGGMSRTGRWYAPMSTRTVVTMGCWARDTPAATITEDTKYIVTKKGFGDTKVTVPFELASRCFVDFKFASSTWSFLQGVRTRLAAKSGASIWASIEQGPGDMEMNRALRDAKRMILKMFPGQFVTLDCARLEARVGKRRAVSVSANDGESDYTRDADFMKEKGLTPEGADTARREVEAQMRARIGPKGP